MSFLCEYKLTEKELFSQKLRVSLILIDITNLLFKGYIYTLTRDL